MPSRSSPDRRRAGWPFAELRSRGPKSTCGSPSSLGKKSESPDDSWVVRREIFGIPLVGRSPCYKCASRRGVPEKRGSMPEAPAVLRQLHDRLVADSWRKSNPFSADLETVNKVLYHPYATLSQKKQAVSSWFQQFQPCLFGRIAAAQNVIHYCLIGETEIQRYSDSAISKIIRDELIEWKRRAFDPNISATAHSFVLLIHSPRLALASPDDRLLQFASHVRDLWGCYKTDEPQGAVHWETLYLRNPETREVIKLEVPVDFFACQGDGRWWHDHRAPGGILFTANSVGHMQKYREWYENRVEQSGWVLQTAMLTIAAAAETPYGRGTWLREVPSNGCPFVEHLRNPLETLRNAKGHLKSKDWTRYGGFFHTDHSIRSEFFSEAPEIPPEVAEREYLQDFSYIYDGASPDYQRLVSGVLVSPDEVDQAIGPTQIWHQVRRRVAKAPKVIGQYLIEHKSAWPRWKYRQRLAQEAELAALIAEIGKWSLLPEEVSQIDEF
jgi:hypothetical protein